MTRAALIAFPSGAAVVPKDAAREHLAGGEPPLPPRLNLERVRAAQRDAQGTGRSTLAVLLDQYNAAPRQLVRELAELFGWESIDTPQMQAFHPRFDLLPLASAMQRQCVLLSGPPGDAADAVGASLQAVLADPFDADLLPWIAARAGAQAATLQYRLALPADIHAYLAQQEALTKAVDSVVEDAVGAQSDAPRAEVLSFTTLSDGASPAVKLVNSTLYDALRAEASDIHLETTPTGLAIKYRIDGVLDTASTVTGRDLAAQAVSRLKVLAELDISERRVPQDGSFRVQTGGREIDLRVSVMPSVHGEDAVIRILDKQRMIQAHGALSLKALGFDDASLAQLRTLVDEPYGMLLVTGPTGSGKTTTLYAALLEVHTGRDKIITIEDPVEYQLPGVLQIPVNEKKGLTFARGLRSILRHDPDKIMVGEIRDRETAEIAVQSALTGHLVLTTVHANNVFDVFGRFSHMGIDPYAFVSALNGIWAQRLVRNVCPHCARPVSAEPDLLKRLGLSPDDVRADKGFGLRAGTGCGDCRGTGYKGRTAVAEILTLNDEIRELIVERASARKIKEAAVRHGTRSLRDAALALAFAGITTLEEVKRVTLQA
jgi:general secretion pathway protein E